MRSEFGDPESVQQQTLGGPGRRGRRENDHGGRVFLLPRFFFFFAGFILIAYFRGVDDKNHARIINLKRGIKGGDGAGGNDLEEGGFLWHFQEWTGAGAGGDELPSPKMKEDGASKTEQPDSNQQPLLSRTKENIIRGEKKASSEKMGSKEQGLEEEKGSPDAITSLVYFKFSLFFK